MADENYKLAKFQAAVFAEVDLKTAQIKQEAELLKEQELEKNKDLQLDRSYNYIQKRSGEIKKHYKRGVAKFNLDKKRELLITRTEITNRIFGNVSAKLSQFVASPDYKAYLLNLIKEFTEKNNITNITIFLKQSDMSLEKDIKKIVKDCAINETNDIKIGGFIAKNTQMGIYFDETLEQKLVDQKSFFMQKSEFTL